ncbi:MAG: D-alanyl-D-alanine carboxypeptidase family protein [Oscillospiraceae bacterium]|nr:D-alanyl-D-alanine carboxypeptidase family protein [Oscillospiraceae bacterium]
MIKVVNSASAIAMSVVMVLALFLYITPITAGKAEAEAPSAVTAAASVDVLFSSGSKKVTGKYIIRKDCILPEGATLTVKDGGRLYIMPGVEFIVEGALKVSSGGAVYVQGDVNVAETGIISCTGNLKIRKSGCVSLGGRLSVNKGGKVYGMGTLSVLNEFSDISCKGNVTAKIKAPQPVEKDGVTTIGGIIIVNREFSLPENYGSGLVRSAYNAYLQMKKASGYDMEILSGYRSYQKQEETFAYWEKIDGFEKASTYSAQPGHSEHQTGLAIDITSLNQTYGNTPEGKWLAAHCWEYGFILRYPKNGEKITGYIYEPWHVRYLGKSTAKLVHDSGLTLEEFLGVDR